MDNRHPIPNGVTPRAEVACTGIVKARGRSDFVPLRKQKACRVELEIGPMDVILVAYGETADRLAAVATASVVRASGELHITQWSTGDGRIHQAVAVKVENLDVQT